MKFGINVIESHCEYAQKWKLSAKMTPLLRVVCM